MAKFGLKQLQTWSYRKVQSIFWYP